MIVPHEHNQEAGVLMLFDADRREDLNALFGWTSVGMLKGEPERVGEGKFVVLLEPGIHDVVKVER